MPPRALRRRDETAASRHRRGRRERPLELDVLVGLAKHLGRNDAYWEVFDPTHKETPVEGSVALDLSEIRFDLQQGLLALERGAPLEAVVWEWRWGLDNHWGNHLVNALRAIHWQAGW